MKPYHLMIIVAVSVVVGFLIGFLRPKNAPNPPIEEKVDTLYIRDTITVKTPVFIERHFMDSVLVPVNDTLRLHDTLFVYMERERVVWSDSLSTVYASGIRPEIDSVIHYVNERVITKEITVERVKKCHWGVGVTAGYGAGKDGLTPFVGVGISYNILSW